MNNAVGLLKEELRRCSHFMQAADATRSPPAGRWRSIATFAAFLTEKIEAQPLITLVRGEVTGSRRGDR